MNFCSACGSSDLVLKVPPGDNRPRRVCLSCGTVHYENPKMVVGTLVEVEGGLLLCRRAIEPRRGLWTFPGGFLELDESTAEGALRETYEEALARVALRRPFGHFDIPHIGQAYILFKATLAPAVARHPELGLASGADSVVQQPVPNSSPAFGAGEESLEVRVFSLDEIPWADLAFSVVRFALQLFVDDRRAGREHYHYAVVYREPSEEAYDIRSYSLRDHQAIALSESVRPGSASHV